jgi:hypothetical protein
MTHYTGGCHCGAVRFTAETEIEQSMSCNCSICRKRGTLLAFLPAGNFTLTQGEDRLTQYNFNQRRIDHMFCSTCGILPFARGAKPDGSSMIALNLRCVDGLEFEKLKVVEFDGAS